MFCYRMQDGKWYYNAWNAAQWYMHAQREHNPIAYRITATLWALEASQGVFDVPTIGEQHV